MRFAAERACFSGICLGLQLLFERGDEGVPTDGAAVESADPLGAGLAPGTVFEAEGRRWARVWDCCTARAPFCPRGASRCRTWAGTRSI